MSFARNPTALVRAHALGTPVTRIIVRDEIATIEREQDPFGLVHGCVNPAGHQPITSCGEIVCVHCSRVFWR